MNELYKTLIFVAVALLLTGAAFVTTRDRASRNEAFNDQGQPFFPDFKDPLALHRPRGGRIRAVDGHVIAVSSHVQR